MLEIVGSKGLVQVNGTTIKRNSSCMLNSGDEVVFGANHAYVSFSLVLGRFFVIFFLVFSFM